MYHSAFVITGFCVQPAVCRLYSATLKTTAWGYGMSTPKRPTLEHCCHWDASHVIDSLDFSVFMTTERYPKMSREPVLFVLSVALSINCPINSSIIRALTKSISHIHSIRLYLCCMRPYISTRGYTCQRGVVIGHVRWRTTHQSSSETQSTRMP